MQIEKKKCIRCQRSMKTNNFYTSKNIDLHPDGYLSVCKECSLMFYEYHNPATFMKVLAEANVPWVPHAYLEVLYAEFNPSRPNNISIVGKYISKMKLTQYKKYDYSQSVQAQIDSGYTDNEISDPTLYKLPAWDMAPTFVIPLDIDSSRMPEGTRDDTETKHQKIGGMLIADEEEAQIIAGIDINILTKSDISYLSSQWGATTSIEDCINCERRYQEMITNEYEVEMTIHRDQIRKACMVSLRADKALENGDFEGYQKLMKVYENIIKIMNLQPKNGKDEEDKVRAIGVIAKICESEDFIPRWNLKTEMDKVDYTITDMKLYLKRLITNDRSIKERMDEVEQKIRDFDSAELEILEEEQQKAEIAEYKRFVEEFDDEEDDEPKLKATTMELN